MVVDIGEGECSFEGEQTETFDEFLALGKLKF